MSNSEKIAVLSLTAMQKNVLGKIIKSTTMAQSIVQRATIINMLADGNAKRKTAHKLGIDKNTVKKWCNRWLATYPKLIKMESTETSNKKYKKNIIEILKDAPRSGAPPEFTPEQIVHIVSIGCEVLDDSNRPTSRWTHKEIAQKAINRKIVETISPGSIG